jgi:rubredoxin
MDYVCSVCGYVYKQAEGVPDEDIAAGTAWEDVPDDFTCPICGVDKSNFGPA